MLDYWVNSKQVESNGPKILFWERGVRGNALASGKFYIFLTKIHKFRLKSAIPVKICPPRKKPAVSLEKVFPLPDWSRIPGKMKRA